MASMHGDGALPVLGVRRAQQGPRGAVLALLMSGVGMGSVYLPWHAALARLSRHSTGQQVPRVAPI